MTRPSRGSYGHEDKYFRTCCRKARITEVMPDALFDVHLRAATPALDGETTVNLALLQDRLDARCDLSGQTMGFAYDQIH